MIKSNELKVILEKLINTYIYLKKNIDILFYFNLFFLLIYILW